MPANQAILDKHIIIFIIYENFISTLFFDMFFHLSVQSKACSAFLLTGKNYNVVGFSENWKTMPGMIIINKRGVLKRNISWQNLTTNQLKANKHWTSKFGFATFNLL